MRVWRRLRQWLLRPQRHLKVRRSSQRAAKDSVRGSDGDEFEVVPEKFLNVAIGCRPSFFEFLNLLKMRGFSFSGWFTVSINFSSFK